VCARRVVVTDTNVLINLIHVDALRLLGSLPGFEFVVVDDVLQEITRPEQANALSAAMTHEWIRRVSLDRPEGIALFSELTRVVERGEAASLSWAVVENAVIACDEKRVFRREALARVGEARMLTTPGIFVLAIRLKLLTVDEADRMKAVLERNRFKMAFTSFREFT
jgi:predicted nucleic acid-binding protein